MKAYAQLFSFKAELDPAVAAIAGNNMVALRGTRDLFDSWKKCRANIASEAQLKKLTKRQRRATMLKVPAAAFPLLPGHCLLPGAAWDARLRAWAAPRILEARRNRPDLSGSSWCGHQRVPSRPFHRLRFTIQARLLLQRCAALHPHEQARPVQGGARLPGSNP